MEIRQLEYFLACARCSSLTAAADELYTTQPHVSVVIRSLERELGVRLFRRKRNGIELTRAGENILAYAERAIRNTELIKAAAGDDGGRILRVAANSSSNLASLTSEYFRACGGGLSMRYTECGTERVLAAVADGRADLGFVFVPERKLPALSRLAGARGAEFEPLVSAGLVVHVGPNSRLFGAGSIEPEELGGLRFVQQEDDYFTLLDVLSSTPSMRGRLPVMKKGVVSNSDYLISLLLHETDLCCVGSFWLQHIHRLNDFHCVPIRGTENSVRFGCLRRRQEPANTDAEDFLAYLRDAIARDR